MTKINPALIDIFPKEHDGYPAHLAAQDTRNNLMAAVGDSFREFPPAMWIEENRWKEVASENDRNKTWPVNWVDRFTNQGSGNGGVSTHECTGHSARTIFEAARNRQRGISLGPPIPKQRLPVSALSASVWISVLSIYAEANPGEWGGANVRQLMEILCDRGALPDKIQPREYGFKHTMQGTRGAGGINQSRGEFPGWRDGTFRDTPDDWADQNWKETAAWFKAAEVVFPESWEQAVCLVLNGHGVGVGRSGHAVPWMFWNPDGGEMGYIDSYDRILYDSKRTQQAAWRGSFAIISTTAPDDWDHPAGGTA